MLNDLIASLPPLRDKEEMLAVLQREEYGFLPSPPDKLEFDVKENAVKNYCAGKAKLHRVTLTVTVKERKFSFPVTAVIPTAEGKHPFYVMLNFRPEVPDRYLPSEELVDHGFAVLSFCYKDVSSDDGDFSDGLASLFFEGSERPDNAPGKLMLWAWAAMRVLDYAETCKELDLNRAGVCGHSRLGKTALLAGALDERFSFVHSNDSGCSGAALSLNKTGERIADITRVFPYWFCPRYASYAEKDESLPFDQHWLLACIAPRAVLVSSADGDHWAHPDNEFLTCLAANEAWETKGQSGFLAPDRFPETGELFGEGTVTYFLRKGKHYFSREDWNASCRVRKEKNV